MLCNRALWISKTTHNEAWQNKSGCLPPDSSHLEIRIPSHGSVLLFCLLLLWLPSPSLNRFSHYATNWLLLSCPDPSYSHCLLPHCLLRWITILTRDCIFRSLFPTPHAVNICYFCNCAPITLQFPFAIIITVQQVKVLPFVHTQ